VFEDRTVFISGAGGGIGRATACLFAQHGARLALVDIDEESCGETAELARRDGAPDALVINADVAEPDACREAVRRTVCDLGGLHHAFNNAGVRGQIHDPWDEESIAASIAVNLHGVIWAMKHQIAHMVEHGGGTIVNTSSIAGLSGNVGAMDYTAAKHGVVGLSKAAAIRYGGAGVRINVVCPGVIESPMTISGLDNTPGAREAIRRLSPILGVMGRPEDVGQAVLWLSSPRSRFVYGVALPVDGGFSIN
jgi:NAD(P)-dependent dehydrogenase (short-subunit alcohol dehydrogenase family)